MGQFVSKEDAIPYDVNGWRRLSQTYLNQLALENGDDVGDGRYYPARRHSVSNLNLKNPEQTFREYESSGSRPRSSVSMNDLRTKKLHFQPYTLEYTKQLRDNSAKQFPEYDPSIRFPEYNGKSKEAPESNSLNFDNHNKTSHQPYFDDNSRVHNPLNQKQKFQQNAFPEYDPLIRFPEYNGKSKEAPELNSVDFDRSKSSRQSNFSDNSRRHNLLIHQQNSPGQNRSSKQTESYQTNAPINRHQNLKNPNQQKFDPNRNSAKQYSEEDRIKKSVTDSMLIYGRSKAKPVDKQHLLEQTDSNRSSPKSDSYTIDSTFDTTESTESKETSNSERQHKSNDRKVGFYKVNGSTSNSDSGWENSRNNSRESSMSKQKSSKSSNNSELSEKKKKFSESSSERRSPSKMDENYQFTPETNEERTVSTHYPPSVFPHFKVSSKEKIVPRQNSEDDAYKRTNVPLLSYDDVIRVSNEELNRRQRRRADSLGNNNRRPHYIQYRGYYLDPNDTKYSRYYQSFDRPKIQITKMVFIFFAVANIAGTIWNSIYMHFALIHIEMGEPIEGN